MSGNDVVGEGNAELFSGEMDPEEEVVFFEGATRTELSGLSQDDRITTIRKKKLHNLICITRFTPMATPPKYRNVSIFTQERHDFKVLIAHNTREPSSPHRCPLRWLHLIVKFRFINEAAFRCV